MIQRHIGRVTKAFVPARIESRQNRTTAQNRRLEEVGSGCLARLARILRSPRLQPEVLSRTLFPSRASQNREDVDSLPPGREGRGCPTKVYTKILCHNNSGTL